MNQIIYLLDYFMLGIFQLKKDLERTKDRLEGEKGRQSMRESGRSLRASDLDDRRGKKIAFKSFIFFVNKNRYLNLTKLFVIDRSYRKHTSPLRDFDVSPGNIPC